MGLRILPLSALVANQIAAGEVIERPASVVKELLENALDAGASSISIEVGFGGLNQIKISDNGSGIVAEDLPLAIAPHATSKITELCDLSAIASMGFRGEALASIASVSRLTLSSKPDGQEHAMMLQAFGSDWVLSPAARSRGTTVDVCDLFFNAPVRKKFLKSEQLEYQAIEGCVKRFALSAPEIAIDLKHNDRSMLSLLAALNESSRLVRIQKILGKAFLENAFTIDVTRAGMRLQGWVCNATYHRSQNDKQLVYINQRMVKDKLISHAIKQSYEGLMHPGRYPACLLYLTIPADELDVNVHPTKHEVRFQDPRMVHDFIRSTLLKTHNKDLMPSLLGPSTQATPTVPMFAKNSNFKRTYQVSYEEGARAQSEWVVLNAQFVLVFLGKEPFLVDVQRAHRDRLLSLLQKVSYPLACRPLLVPVRVPFDGWDTVKKEECQRLLAHWGMAIHWANDGFCVVETLPILFPRIDVQAFVQSMQHIPLHEESLKTQFIKCHSFDVALAEDRNECLEYLNNRYVLNEQMEGCLRLDQDTCRELNG